MGECWACCEEVRGGGGGGKFEEEEEEEKEEEEDKSTGPMFSKDVVNLESSTSVLFVFIAIKKKKKQGKITPQPHRTHRQRDIPWGGGKEREGIRQGQNREKGGGGRWGRGKEDIIVILRSNDGGN